MVAHVRPPRRRRVWRFLRWTAVVVLTAWLLRGLWLAPLLRAQVETSLGRALGGSWSIGELRGGLLADVELLDVVQTGGKDLRDTRCTRLVLHWAPTRLLQGDVLGALRELRLEGFAGTLVLAESGGSRGGFAVAELSRLDPGLRLHADGALSLERGGHQLDLGDLCWDGTLAQSRLALRPVFAGQALPELTTELAWSWQSEGRLDTTWSCATWNGSTGLVLTASGPPQVRLEAVGPGDSRATLMYAAGGWHATATALPLRSVATWWPTWPAALGLDADSRLSAEVEGVGRSAKGRLALEGIAVAGGRATASADASWDGSTLSGSRTRIAVAATAVPIQDLEAQVERACAAPGSDGPVPWLAIALDKMSWKPGATMPIVLGARWSLRPPPHTALPLDGAHLRGTVTLDGTGLTAQAQVAGSDRLDGELTATFPLDAAAELRGQASLRAREMGALPVQAKTLALDLRLAGSLAVPELAWRIEGEDVRWSGRRLERISAAGSLRPRELSVSELRLRAASDAECVLTQTAKLRWMGGDWRLDGLRATGAGLELAVDAAGNGRRLVEIGGTLRLDLARTWLGLLLPSEWALPGIEGDLRAEGNWREGAWSATVTGAGLAADLPDFLPPLTGGSLRVHLDPSRIAVQELRLHLGGAPLDATGEIPWAAETAGQLAVQGRDVLLLQQPNLRLRADIDLDLTGSRHALALAGRIGATDLLVSSQFNWLEEMFSHGGTGGASWEIPPPWDRLALAVALRDGGLDRAPGSTAGVRLRTNVYNGPLAIALEVRGTLGRPMLSGNVTANDGMLALPFSRFAVERAELLWRSTDSWLDPALQARATARMQGYDVLVQADGRVRSPRLDVSTVPHLSPANALLLASTGLLPADLAASPTASALGTALPWLGNELYRRLYGPPDPDAPEWLLDRFELTANEQRSESGLSTVRIEYRMGPRLHLYAERDEWEEYNGGLLWRWRLDGPPKPAPAPPPPAESDIGADWSIVPMPTGARLPRSPRLLLKELRRSHAVWRATRTSGAQAGAGAEALLLDASHQLEQRLHALGHGSATVKAVAIPAPQDSGAAPDAKVRFLVHPGPRLSLDEVTVGGVPETMAEAVRRLVAAAAPRGTLWEPALAGRVRLRLLEFLYLAGHATARVKIASPIIIHDQVRLILELDAGPAFTVGPASLNPIVGIPLDAGAEARLRTELEAMTGRPWQRVDQEWLRQRLQTVLRGEARLLAEVALDAGMPSRGGPTVLPLTATITPGPELRLGQIVVQGLARTRPAYARHRLRGLEGRRLDGTTHDAVQERLRSSSLFSRVGVELRPHDTPDADGLTTADLTVTVEEAPAQTLTAHLGYGSWEQLRGGLSLRDANLFGLGRSGNLEVEISQRHAQGRGLLTDRDLLGGSRELSLSGLAAWREEPSFDRTTYSLDVATRLPLTGGRGRDRLELGYGYAAERAEDRSAEVENVEQDGFLITARVQTILRLDRLDDRWLPRHGWLLEAGLGLADEAIGSELDYWEPSLRAGLVLPVQERQVLALSAAAQSRQPTDGAPSLPIQSRLFLGGANSVRSFGASELSPLDAEGDALGGLSTAYASVEWRVRVAGELHGALFYDIGVVDEEALEFDDDVVGQAIGAGIRWHLPVGPLRLDVAYNPDELYAADHHWAAHLAIGFTF